MSTILLFVFLTIFSYVTWSILYKMVRLLRRIKKTLFNIEHLLTPEEASVIEFYLQDENGRLIKVETMQDLKVTENRKALLTITDKKGNPAKVDGAPVWESSAPELLVIEPMEDGLTAVLKPVGPLGNVSVQVKADADLGEGVKPVTGQMDLNLVAGDAEILSLALGEVVPE